MKALLRAVGIGKSFGAKRVLENASLTVNKNEVICILGASGGGKTTLLRCLNLLEYIDGGFIEYAGHRVIEGNGKSPRRSWKSVIVPPKPFRLLVSEDEYRRRFGVVFQSYNLFPSKTVVENLIEGPVFVLAMKPPDARALARSCLEAVGMADRESALPSELSGGEQQRVAIARALAMQSCEILLLDEITSALDPPRVASLLGLIKKLRQERHLTMVIVTHHIDFAKDVADRVCFLDGGTIVEEGPPADVFSNPKTPAFKAFLEAVQASR